MKTIKWGIIGIGNIADKFAHDLQHVSHAELVGVASNSQERADTFAQKYGVKNAFGSYEELFTIDLDVVYIATPHTDHARCTIMCLENKVGVLCEKPFAMNAEEVASMIECARENDTFLMEALWSRFLPTIKKTLELVESGKIGEVQTIHADFGFIPPFNPDRRVLNPALGGGAFLDIGIYPAFISYLLLGNPSKILATSIKGPTKVDETTTFLYQFDDKATASLNCTFAAKTNTDAFIYGSKGMIHLPARFHEGTQVVLHHEDGSKETYDFPRETYGYDFEAVEVVKCLQEGKKESDLWSLKDSENLINLLDKTREEANIKYS